MFPQNIHILLFRHGVLFFFGVLAVGNKNHKSWKMLQIFSKKNKYILMFIIGKCWKKEINKNIFGYVSHRKKN
jgi:hypothetical protein